MGSNVGMPFLGTGTAERIMMIQAWALTPEKGFFPMSGFRKRVIIKMQMFCCNALLL
jgi:hypothetical protein